MKLYKNALRAANSGIGMRVGLGRILGCKLGGLNSGCVQTVEKCVLGWQEFWGVNW